MQRRDPLGGVERRIGVEMVEQQREGAAAVARGDVAGADQALQQAGDVAQRGVAGDAAMAVVDRLQIVDVDRDQRGGRAVAGGLAQHALELGAELARIEQGGERVAAGILLGLAQLGAGVGQSGAEQRILVGQPLQRLARLARGLIGQRRLAGWSSGVPCAPL